MDYMEKKNELWQKILEERTKKTTLDLSTELIDYLKSWEFIRLDFEDVFEEDLSGESEEVHSGIRYWDIETNGKFVEFSKKENYHYSDIPDEWKYNVTDDFETYLIERFKIEVDELMWTLETIDEMIFTI